MAEATITAVQNGPYRVDGDVELIDQNGEPIEVTGSTVLLCRCGGSANKPFCDGTHARIGFRSRSPSASAEAGGAHGLGGDLVAHALELREHEAGQRLQREAGLVGGRELPAGGDVGDGVGV